MSAVFRQNHPETIVGPVEEAWVTCFSDKAREELAAIIWWHTSPYIRSRTPEFNSRTCLNDLLHALRRVACPFRFMDLPPEVRLRIYAMIPSSNRSVVTLTNDHRRLPRNTKNQRSFMCVNRQIRTEALPVYHRGRRFQITWRLAKNPQEQGRPQPLNTRLSGIDIVALINDWASVLRSDTLRLLRHLVVGTPVMRHSLQFSLDHNDGKYSIRCTDYAFLQLESQSRILEHAAAVSVTAGALKLEGEALLLLLTSRPEIWDQCSGVFGH